MGNICRGALRALSAATMASALLAAGHGCKEPEPGEPPGPCDDSLAARQARASCQFEPGSTCTDGAPKVPIQYVFVLMLENRSFDNYYGRFQAYLKDVLHRNDVRTEPYVDQETPDGIDVPGTPYELLDECHKKQQDKRLDGSYDPRKDAPFNPTEPGKDPPDAAAKHYWSHAKDPLDFCVSDTCHEWWCSHMAWNSGRMDGFFAANDGYYEGGEPKTGNLNGSRAMLYYDQTDIPFYYWLADRFAIADHYFSSMLGPTWPNRDYLYAATSRGLTSNGGPKYGDSNAFSMTNPTCVNKADGTSLYGKDQPALPQVQQRNGKDLNTIYDVLLANGVEFTQWVRNRYSNIVAPARWSTWYGADGVFAAPLRKRKYTYDSQNGGGFGLESDVKAENDALKAAIKAQGTADVGPQGILFPVNFIDPAILEDVNGEDEHPPGVPQMGQRLSYDVVRVLMSNEEVWKRSVLFITYDEAGGFYDHVPPPNACAPDGNEPKYPGGAYGINDHGDTSDAIYGGRFDRYGVRVPLLVVSPWVKRGYVSHYTYDHTSIVRFIEGRFGLPALTKRDANADPLLDFFDVSNAAAKLAGKVSDWGKTDELDKLGFPSTPSVPPDQKAEPRTTAAHAVKWFGGPEGELYQQQASAACRAAYPAATSPSEICNILGSNTFGGYQWSTGKPRPPGYDANVSKPFPLLPPVSDDCDPPPEPPACPIDQACLWCLDGMASFGSGWKDGGLEVRWRGDGTKVDICEISFKADDMNSGGFVAKNLGFTDGTATPVTTDRKHLHVEKFPGTGMVNGKFKQFFKGVMDADFNGSKVTGTLSFTDDFMAGMSYSVQFHGTICGHPPA